MRIQFDHVLRAYENVCRRLAQTVTVARAAGRCPARSAWPLTSRDLPDLAADRGATLSRTSPSGAASRTWPSACAGHDQECTGGYASAAVSGAQSSTKSVAPSTTMDLDRVVSGELQDLRWQLANVRLPRPVARGPTAQRGSRGDARGRESDGARGRARRHGDRGARDVPRHAPTSSGATARPPATAT